MTTIPLTPTAAGKIAACSAVTIIRAIQDGKLHATMHGRNYAVSEPDLRHWMDGQNRANRRVKARQAWNRIKVK